MCVISSLGNPETLESTKKSNLSLCVGDIHARWQLLKISEQRPQRSQDCWTQKFMAPMPYGSYGLYGFTLFDAICVYMPGWEKNHLKPGWCSTRPLPRSSGPSEETPAANGGVHNAPAHPEQNAKSVLQSHWKEMLLFGELVCIYSSLEKPNRPKHQT